MPEIRQWVEEALLSDDILTRAQALWRTVAADVLDRNHGRIDGRLRASDAGRCVRELWAEIHGKRDLPEDAQGLLKMNAGSLIGAWLACLLGAGAEAHGYTAHAEVLLEGQDGVSGHCDLSIGKVINGAVEPLVVIEFKQSFWTGAHDGPKSYHLVQAAKYASLIGAPYFVVVQYLPGTQARFDKALGTKVAQPHIEPSQVYKTSEYTEIAAKDYDRLRAALKDERPEGDPSEGFRCRSCRYGACERNENPANPRPKPKQEHAIT